MALTQKELEAWTVDLLKNYLVERGVTVSGGGSRKADLIKKVIAAELLELAILPSIEKKSEEIADRRVAKLKVDGITIPFPEVLVQGWLDEGICLFPRFNYELFKGLC